MSSRTAEKQQKRNFSEISDTESDLEENDRPNNSKKLIKVKAIKKQGAARITRKSLSASPIANAINNAATMNNADSDSEIGESITGENTENNKDVPEEAEKLKLDDKKTKVKYSKPFTGLFYLL
jgi:hypothetical protein